MRRGFAFTFIFGLLIGGMAALLFWYYQKSTSAEDGALALLDKWAIADRRLRQVQAEQAAVLQAPIRIRLDDLPTDEVPSFLQQNNATEPDDLTAVKGIGPKYAARLNGADIETVAQLTAVNSAQLAEILNISENRAKSILAEAKNL